MHLVQTGGCHCGFLNVVLPETGCFSVLLSVPLSNRDLHCPLLLVYFQMSGAAHCSYSVLRRSTKDFFLSGWFLAPEIREGPFLL